MRETLSRVAKDEGDLRDDSWFDRPAEELGRSCRVEEKDDDKVGLEELSVWCCGPINTGTSASLQPYIF